MEPNKEVKLSIEIGFYQKNLKHFGVTCIIAPMSTLHAVETGERRSHPDRNSKTIFSGRATRTPTVLSSEKRKRALFSSSRSHIFQVPSRIQIGSLFQPENCRDRRVEGIEEEVDVP